MTDFSSQSLPPENSSLLLIRDSGPWMEGNGPREHSSCLPVATTGEFVATVVRWTNVYPREGKRWLCNSRQKIKTRVEGKKLNVWDLVLESSWEWLGVSSRNSFQACYLAWVNNRQYSHLQVLFWLCMEHLSPRGLLGNLLFILPDSICWHFLEESFPIPCRTLPRPAVNPPSSHLFSLYYYYLIIDAFSPSWLSVSEGHNL